MIWFLRLFHSQKPPYHIPLGKTWSILSIDSNLLYIGYLWKDLLLKYYIDWSLILHSRILQNWKLWPDFWNHPGDKHHHAICQALEVYFPKFPMVLIPYSLDICRNMYCWNTRDWSLILHSRILQNWKLRPDFWNYPRDKRHHVIYYWKELEVYFLMVLISYLLEICGNTYYWNTTDWSEIPDRLLFFTGLYFHR